MSPLAVLRQCVAPDGLQPRRRRNELVQVPGHSALPSAAVPTINLPHGPDAVVWMRLESGEGRLVRMTGLEGHGGEQCPVPHRTTTWLCPVLPARGGNAARLADDSGGLANTVGPNRNKSMPSTAGWCGNSAGNLTDMSLWKPLTGTPADPLTPETYQQHAALDKTRSPGHADNIITLYKLYRTFQTKLKSL
jgi:hypothetical protein